MKKKAIFGIVCGIALLAFSSCKSMKGCGLTSDAQKVQPTTVTVLEMETVTE